MKPRTNRIIYYIATGLLTALMLMSITMYFFNHEEVVGMFEALGYPSYLIYPLAIAKLLGLIAIWTNKSKTLKEWAYAGFFFDFTLAFVAHLHANDGGYPFAVAALIFLFTSYYFGKKSFD